MDMDAVDDLELGAQLCGRCGQPFALVGQSSDGALPAHLAVMRTMAQRWQVPGYLVLERSGPRGEGRVLRVEGQAEPTWLAPAGLGDDQEAAYGRHRCPAVRGER